MKNKQKQYHTVTTVPISIPLIDDRSLSLLAAGTSMKSDNVILLHAPKHHIFVSIPFQNSLYIGFVCIYRFQVNGHFHNKICQQHLINVQYILNDRSLMAQERQELLQYVSTIKSEDNFETVRVNIVKAKFKLKNANTHVKRLE